MTNQQPVPDEAKLTDEEIWNNWYKGSGFEAQMQTFPPDKLGQRASIMESTRKMIIENDRISSDAATEKAWAYLLNMAGEDRNMEGKELQAYLRGRFSEEMFIQKLVTEHDAAMADYGNRLMISAETNGLLAAEMAELQGQKKLDNPPAV